MIYWVRRGPGARVAEHAVIADHDPRGLSNPAICGERPAEVGWWASTGTDRCIHCARALFREYIWIECFICGCRALVSNNDPIFLQIADGHFQCVASNADCPLASRIHNG